MTMQRTDRQPNTVYIRRIRMLNLPFHLQTMCHKTKEVALIYSGATKNFLDIEV